MLIAAACGVLVLAGCSGDEASEPTSGPTVVRMPVSGNHLVVAGPVDDSEAGSERLTGQPVFVNGCLGAQAGTKTYLVAWPSGTNVAGPDSDAIEYDGQVLEPGSSFVGRGTFVSTRPLPRQFPTLPSRCLAANQEKIAWVQRIDEIEE